MKTIHEAITTVLQEEKKPLSSKEIYDRIIEKNYYTFQSKDPRAIVSGEIRKRCEGSKTLSGKVLYKKVSEGSYMIANG